MKDCYCDRCKSRQATRYNRTQVRCGRCGAFLLRRRPGDTPTIPREHAPAAFPQGTLR